jgi:group I intron endonuclease
MKKIDTSSGIYCFENLINGKKYIGQAVDINRRYKRHLFELRENISPNAIMQTAWNKYSEDNFYFCILEECPIEKLDEKEIYYIDTLKSHCRENGYNISFGGNAPMKGIKASDEHKAKCAMAQVGTKKGNRKGLYIGVREDSCGCFTVRIRNIYTKERIYLGYYRNEIDAAKTYDEKSWEFYHNLLKLNFPENYIDMT